MSIPHPILFSAVAGLAVLMLTSGCGWPGGHDERTVTFTNGSAADDETGVRLVSAAADGNKVRYTTEDDPPPAPNLDFATRVGDAGGHAAAGRGPDACR